MHFHESTKCFAEKLAEFLASFQLFFLQIVWLFYKIALYLQPEYKCMAYGKYL